MATNNEAPQQQMWSELKLAKHGHSKTAWLMSFIDLTGILVGFFVLVFSTQEIDRSSWQQLSGGFRAAFNPKVSVVSTIPDGQANAYQIVSTKKDVLPYLDSLLRGRLEHDPVWQDLNGKKEMSGTASEMTYLIPHAALDVTNVDAKAAWARLATILRAWKNPVTVRVVVLEGAPLDKGAELAMKMAAEMHAAGAPGISAEVVSGNMGAVQLVVRGE